MGNWVCHMLGKCPPLWTISPALKIASYKDINPQTGGPLASPTVGNDRAWESSASRAACSLGHLQGLLSCCSCLACDSLTAWTPMHIHIMYSCCPISLLSLHSDHWRGSPGGLHAQGDLRGQWNTGEAVMQIQVHEHDWNLDLCHLELPARGDRH